MAQLQILETTRDDLRDIKNLLKNETGETMSQIVQRLADAEKTLLEFNKNNPQYLQNIELAKKTLLEFKKNNPQYLQKIELFKKTYGEDWWK